MKKEIGYRFLKFNAREPFKLETLPKDFKIKKPTVLVCGGNATYGPMEGNAMIKVGRGLIGLFEPTGDETQGTTDDVDIISLAYGMLEPSGNSGEEEYPTRLLMNEVTEIVDNQFVPMFTDERGFPKKLEDAMEEFNKLTIFTHCYGTTAINEIFAEIEERMSNLGYSSLDISEIFSQVTHVAYAPQTTPCYIPTFEIKTCQDQTIMDWYKMGKVDHAINGIMLEYPEENNKNRVTLWSSQLANGDIEVENEHGIMISRNDNWESETKVGAERVYVGKNADAVSQVAGYILAASVANSILNKQNFIFTPKHTMEKNYQIAEDIINKFSLDDLSMR